MAGQILLHKICAKSCLVKYKFRASDGGTGDCSPEHLSFLFERTTLPSFLECDLTFKIPIKSLGTPRDLRKLSTEKANIVPRLAKETDACVACRLSCSGPLCGREPHFWGCQKKCSCWAENQHLHLKEANRSGQGEVDGSRAHTELPCSQR